MKSAILILAAALPLFGQELLAPALLNPSFESAKPLESWSLFSRTNDATIEASTDAREGKSALHLVNPGEKDWAITNAARIAVKPDQPWLVTAHFKGKGRIEIGVVAYAGKERVSWDIGATTSFGEGDWRRLQSVAVVPEGVDAIQVRLIGTGPADLLIDDLSIAPDKLARTKKPVVQGGAATRVKEKLDRGLVAIESADKVHLSWRLLDSEKFNTAFNVFRTVNGQTARINDQPVTATTDFVDDKPLAGSVYAVRSENEAHPCEAVPVQALPYRSIKMPEGVTFQKVALADLDGDGKLDFVLKTPNTNIDPYEKYWKPSPGTYKLMAFKHDGTPLWTYDMGWSIEQGIWYSPYVVYDFDGDGKAEVAVKAGEGDPRDKDGKVTTGPESVVILDGMTGKEITRAPWPSRENFPSYNYYCRNQLAVAYLDGKTPCLITERGTYNTMKCEAWELRDRKLQKVWSWSDAEDGPAYRGQGAHCLRAADVDGDGRDEVILGSAVLDDNGNGLWSTRMGHPDQCAVGQLDPNRPGLQIAYGYETRQKKNGVCMVDAKTGKLLWGLDRPTTHIHSQGLASDIDPAYPGVEIYGGERDDTTKRYLYSADGKLLSDDKDLGGLAPRAAWFSNTPQRQLLKKTQFMMHDGTPIGPKIEGNFIAAADLIGDWREEVITTLPGELRIYSTTLPATTRNLTLMQDPIYRNDIATASQAYYQLPGISKLPR